MRARRIRVLRGLVAAATATFLAALSHAVSGAEVPGLFALVAASVLAAGICIPLAGRSLSTWRLSASVVLSQLGFHTLFALAPASSGTVTSGGGHHADMMVLTADATAHVHASATPVMWLGHALAAAVTIAALSSGERVLLTLFDTLRLTVRVIWSTLRVAPLGRPALASAEWLPVLAAAERVLLSVMRHRGPPFVGGRIALA